MVSVCSDNLLEKGFDTVKADLESIESPVFLGEDYHELKVVERVKAKRLSTYRIAAPSAREAIDLLCEPEHDFRPEKVEYKNEDIRSRTFVNGLPLFEKRYELVRVRKGGIQDVLSKHDDLEAALKAYSKVSDRNKVHLLEFAIAQEVLRFLRKVF